MIPEFQITDAKIAEIAKVFGISDDSVKDLYETYTNFSPYLRAQPLAHIMRSVECYFRKKLKNSDFIVICEPYANFVLGQKNASADYFQGKKFVINYSSSLSEKDLRVYIAHEIGHLFILAKLDASKKDKRNHMYAGSTEPLCSIFGIFAVSEKSDFYAGYGPKDRNYKDWKDILDRFVGIYNGRKGVRPLPR
jgi:hypothetical protein